MQVQRVKRYGATAVLLIRDEGEYLPEWLEWHLGHGIEHIYIYDDSRERPITEFLGGYAPCCTVQDARRYRYHLQFEAYTDALRTFGGESEWMAFLDTDEFLRVVDGRPLPELLAGIPDMAAAVLAPWIVYNANGQLFKRPGPVRERFTQTTAWLKRMPCWKSVVRPALVAGMSAHTPIEIAEGAFLANAEGNVVKDKYDLPADKLVVDHYYTKSYEEWLERLSKGSCDPFSARKPEWFETLNPGLLDRESIQLGGALIQRMNPKLARKFGIEEKEYE